MASAQLIPNTAYTVGWISAIPTEHTAASLFLDEEHPATDVSPRDENDYTLGRIGRHNVVIAVLPYGEYGISSAAGVATSMLSSFPNIRIGLMVGIGGGAPSPKHDIRLGDIVVSASHNGIGGVFPYEFGKTIQNQSFHTTGVLNQPPSILRAAVSGLISRYERNEGHELQKAIDNALENKKKLQKKYGRPDSESDKLYRSDFIHPNNNDASCAAICGSDSSKLVLRPVRPDDEDIIQIHYGLIASADKLMKDALIRDRLSEEKDVLCFEMEAAGLMNRFPCLVIRGICDYSDTHKNKQWQGYAAMAAAAYAKDVLNRIAPNKVEVERKLCELLIDIHNDIHNIQDHANDVKTRVKELQADGYLDKFRNWLSPPDPSTNFNKAREQHHNGTGQWLLDSNMYLKWKTKRNSFLWLNGIPGCGKTILSSSVVEDIKQCATSSQNLLYFYFDFNDTRKRSLEKAVRSLILQLYNQMGIRKEADALYSSCNNGNCQPCNESLCTLFQSMIQQDSEFWIVLDALDECEVREEGSAYGLLPWIKRLRDLDVNLHILVTSRPEQDIKSAIDKWALDSEIISLQSDLVENDIKTYIKAKTKQIYRWQTRPDVQADIENTLSQKADGMFRWVSCQLDVLNGCLDPPSIRRELANLPKTLDATYERILQNVKPEHVDYTQRLLQFLVYSDRPLRLEEAVDAVTVNISQQPRFDPANRMPIPQEVVRYCSSLVTLVEIGYEEDGKKIEEIQLAHFSVQEYLMSDRLKGNMAKGLKKTTANIAILEVCLSYLLDLDHSYQPEEATRRYPMAEYSAQFWPRHAAIIEQSTKRGINIVEEYLLSIQAFRFGYELHDPDKPWTFKYYNQTHSVNALYYASTTGLFYAARKLVEMGADVNGQGGHYSTALQAASVGGYREIVQILLDNGADVNAQGGHYGTALQAASVGGYREIVQILLYNSADVNAQGGHYGTALQAVSAQGHREIVQILLDNGADVNAQGGIYCTALQAASAQGHQDVVQILLDDGADVNTQGGDYGTALQAASAEGYREIVQILLDNGTDVNAQGGHYGTALQAASAKGHREIVQILLDNGAEVNAQGGNYGTALQAASARGYREIVQILQDKE